MDQEDGPALASTSGHHQPSGAPETVDVLCGDARGTYIVSKGRVLFEGNEISPTEFEKMGGRGSSKKWRNSVRVVLPNRSNGPCIGEWLTKQGLDNIKPRQTRAAESLPVRKPQGPAAAAAQAQQANSYSQLPLAPSNFIGRLISVPQQPPPTEGWAPAVPAVQPWTPPAKTQAQPAANAPSAAAIANLGMAAPALSPTEARPSPARPPVPKAARYPGPSRPQGQSLDLIGHLNRQYLGLIPGDPTVESLPDELPPLPAQTEGADAEASDVTVIDVRSTPYETLMEMSRASAENPLSQLLPEPPGILPEREAHLTGHRPVKRQRTAPSSAAAAAAPAESYSKHEAASMLGDYMAGKTEVAPWEALGLAKQPVIGGRPLELRAFYRAVQEQGGFDAAVANKRWGRVAKGLGIDLASITNAGFVLRIIRTGQEWVKDANFGMPRNNYSKLLLAYETQARALAAALGQPLAQDTSASEPPSAAASAEARSGATPPASATAAAASAQQLQEGVMAEDADAVSSPVQPRSGEAVGAAEQPASMECADDMDVDPDGPVKQLLGAVLARMQQGAAPDSHAALDGAQHEAGEGSKAERQRRQEPLATPSGLGQGIG